MPSDIYYSKNIIHSIDKMYLINRKMVSIYFHIINVFHMVNSTQIQKLIMFLYEIYNKCENVAAAVTAAATAAAETR